MILLFRWLIRIAAAMLAVSVVVVGMVYWLASRSLPEYTAEVEVPNLERTVEIVRDNANVPHIFGPQDADVFFGLGFGRVAGSEPGRLPGRPPGLPADLVPGRAGGLLLERGLWLSRFCSGASTGLVLPAGL